jgi:hypothetical protein
MMKIIRNIFSQIIPSRVRYQLKKIQIKIAPRPMMSEEEIMIMKGILVNNSFTSIVEFGSGGSTLYFSKKISNKSIWMAFEFDKEWYKLLKKRVPHNVELIHLSNLDDLSKYSDQLATASLVFIDSGVSREQILRIVYECCKHSLVILHDAQRKAYESAKSLYAREIMLTKGYAFDKNGECLAGGLSMLLQDQFIRFR